MNNVVTVLLRARDNITPTIAGLRGRLSTLGDVGGATGGGGVNILDRLGLGTLAINGALAGVAAITTSVSLLKNQVESATSAQTATIATAGDVANLTGASFEKAKAAVVGLRREIAQAASKLPGDTAGFTAIASQIIPALAGNVGGDLTRLNKETLDLTKHLGVLAAIRKADPTQSGVGASKFIGGTSSLAELRQLDLFQNNPILLKNIKSLMSAQGLGDDIRKLTERQRIDLLTTAAKKTVTAETLAEFDGTADSYIQGIHTALFDADIGVFGFLKPLKALGGRTGIDAVSGSLGAIVQLGETLAKSMGFDPDTVMIGIVRAIDWFTGLVNNLTGVLNGNSGGLLNNMYAQLYDGAADWVNGLIHGLTDFVRNVQWGQVGDFLGQVVVDIFKGLLKIDWMALPLFALELLKGLVQMLISFTATAVSGLLAATVEQMRERAGDIGKYLSGIWDKIKEVFSSFVKPISTVIKPIFDAFVYIIEAVFGAVSRSLKLVAQPIAAVKSAASTVGNAVNNNVIKPVENTINGGLRAISGGRIGGKDPNTKDEQKPASELIKQLPEIQPVKPNNPQAFAPNVTLYANQNMSTGDQIDMLMQAINNKYLEYQQGVIA